MKRYQIINCLLWVQLFWGVHFSGCDKKSTDPSSEPQPFVVENLGVTFGVWDKQTNFAGDFYFRQGSPKIFSEFGAQVLDPEWNIKELPTFDYILRKEAVVFAIAEGEVVDITYQPESNDYTCSIQSLNNSQFYVIYDHMIQLRLLEGIRVVAGDSIGHPRPLDHELGFVELMINNSETKLSYCPFCFFNEDKADEYKLKLSQLMRDWETFKGDTTIYDEKSYILTGCRYESMKTY